MCIKCAFFAPEFPQVQMAAEIDDEVRAFLAQQIQSIARLETVLLLRANAVPWKASDVAREIGLSVDMTSELLGQLADAGLLVIAHSGELTFQYGASDSKTEELLDKIARLYRERRVSLIESMYDSATNRLRSFSAAFDLRRPRKENRENS